MIGTAQGDIFSISARHDNQQLLRLSAITISRPTGMLSGFGIGGLKKLFGLGVQQAFAGQRVISLQSLDSDQPDCESLFVLTDKAVNLATRKFFPKHGTPKGLLDLGEAKLADYIKTIGLYKTKAKNALATCQILLEQHKGKVPQTREALEALPGVGRKTANVVLNTAFGQPTIAVDTHIFRVSNRTKIAPGKDVVAVEKGLEKFVPDEFKLNVHHWLILHGRYICVARTPKCPQCGIADLCEYRPKTKT